MSFWFNEWKPWCFLVESRWLSWLSAWWYRWSKKVWDCRSSPSSAGVSHCVFVERRKLPGPTIAQPTQCQAAVAQPAVLQLKYLISIQPTQQRKIFPPQTWTVVEFLSLSQTSSKTARLLLLFSGRGPELIRRTWWWQGRREGHVMAGSGVTDEGIRRTLSVTKYQRTSVMCFDSSYLTAESGGRLDWLTARHMLSFILPPVPAVD